MVGTMASVWTNAHAGTVTSSKSLTVVASVGGVTPGPTTPTSTSGSKPKPKPSIGGNPTITIQAEPVGKIPQQSGVYIFDKTRPAFSGTTSVSDGLIFLTIRGTSAGTFDFSSTTKADSIGEWLWQSPIELPEGSYNIRAAVFDSSDLTRSGNAEANFAIKIPPGQKPPSNTNGNTNKNTNTGQKPPIVPGVPQIPGIPNVPPPTITPGMMFGVFVNVLDKYKYVTAGDQLQVLTTLITNSDKPAAKQDVHYTVVDPSGNVILETTDTITFDKKSEQIKTFFTAPKTPPGDYKIIVSGVYDGIVSVAADYFRVLEAPSATTVVLPTDGGSWWLLWLILILLWLLFMTMVIIAYRYVRHHTRELQNYMATQANARS